MVKNKKKLMAQIVAALVLIGIIGTMTLVYFV